MPISSRTTDASEEDVEEEPLEEAVTVRSRDSCRAARWFWPYVGKRSGLASRSAFSMSRSRMSIVLALAARTAKCEGIL